MRGLILFTILIGLLISCQDKKVYTDENFTGFVKGNDTIFPYGTYKGLENELGITKAAFYLDSSDECRLIYSDSLGMHYSKGNWIKKTTDTQVFDFSSPFQRAYIQHNRLVFMDSIGEMSFEKYCDTLLPDFFNKGNE